MTQSKVLSCQ